MRRWGPGCVFNTLADYKNGGRKLGRAGTKTLAGVEGQQWEDVNSFIEAQRGR